MKLPPVAALVALRLLTVLGAGLGGAPAASVPFEAIFSGVQTIGSSNYTHYWMPSPLSKVSAAPDAPLYAHIDLCGDGTKCPPPIHPQPAGAYLTEPATGGPWVAEATHLATNALIRLNGTSTRGFGSIVLDTSTNNTATASYNDWVASDGTVSLVSHKAGSAPVTGLPPMLMIAYFQSTPSAVLKTVSGGEIAFAQFYAYLASAPRLGGCTGGVKMCYSTITLASEDKGASWQYRSAINWDKSQMPPAVEGPCEPTLVALPDGKTLLSIFRLNSYQNLWQATSLDQGRTWSMASETSAWAVFPQAKVLPTGAVVLTSGRPGIGLWLADGRGAAAPTSWKFCELQLVMQLQARIVRAQLL